MQSSICKSVESAMKRKASRFRSVMRSIVCIGKWKPTSEANPKGNPRVCGGSVRVACVERCRYQPTLVKTAVKVMSIVTVICRTCTFV